ncbi:MAG: hypothetical protein QM500_20205 [Methylococcales bacterium]
MHFLITGGLQRTDATKLGEGKRFYKAVLNRLDWQTGEAECLLSIDEESDHYANDHYADDTPNLLFTSATLLRDKLYVCSETEVFVYEYPSMKLLNSCSLPHFQNIHHVTVCNGYVAVASTGLDLVIFLDPDSLEPVKFMHALGEEPWHRFDQQKDYRKVHSTKPHDAHPNFVFEIDGQPWATRFNQKDAVCLEDMSKRIDIGVERVHDGHVIGDFVYFTSVNGSVIIANKNTLEVEEVIDLNKWENTDSPLGWCRGMAIKDNRMFVGFSRIRKTPIKENINWMLNFVGARECFDTRVVEYDILQKEKVTERILTRNVTDVVYSVIDENQS